MTNGKIMKIEGDGITSGNVLALTTNAGSNMRNAISSSGIVEVKASNILANTDKTVIGTPVSVYVNASFEACKIFRSAGAILSVAGNHQSEGTLVDIEGDSLSNGKALNVHSSSMDSTSRSLVVFDNDGSGATKTQVLSITQKASHSTGLAHLPGAALAINSLVEEAIFARVSSSNARHGATISLARDRSLDPTGNPVGVHDKDVLGKVSFQGFADETSRAEVATISAVVHRSNDANVSSDIMGGELIFSTSSENVNEVQARMTISNSGIEIGGSSQGIRLGRPPAKAAGTDLEIVGQNANGTSGQAHRGGNVVIKTGQGANNGTTGELILEGKTNLRTPTSNVSADENFAHVSVTPGQVNIFRDNYRGTVTTMYVRSPAVDVNEGKFGGSATLLVDGSWNGRPGQMHVVNATVYYVDSENAVILDMEVADAVAKRDSVELIACQDLSNNGIYSVKEIAKVYQRIDCRSANPDFNMSCSVHYIQNCVEYTNVTCNSNFRRVELAVIRTVLPPNITSSANTSTCRFSTTQDPEGHHALLVKGSSTRSKIEGNLHVEGGLRVSSVSVHATGAPKVDLSSSNISNPYASQTDAAAIDGSISIVNLITTADGQAARLPPAVPGLEILVSRSSEYADVKYALYPSLGNNVNTQKNNLPMKVLANEILVFCNAVSFTEWTCATRTASGGLSIKSLDLVGLGYLKGGLKVQETMEVVAGTDVEFFADIKLKAALLSESTSSFHGPMTSFGGLEVQGNSVVIATNSNDALAQSLGFRKSRSSVAGDHAVVQNEDVLGEITWSGSDGSNFDMAASIRAESTGGDGSGDISGRLVFSTSHAGASTPLESLSLSSEKTTVTLGDNSPGGYIIQTVNSSFPVMSVDTNMSSGGSQMMKLTSKNMEFTSSKKLNIVASTMDIAGKHMAISMAAKFSSPALILDSGANFASVSIEPNLVTTGKPNYTIYTCDIMCDQTVVSAPTVPEPVFLMRTIGGSNVGISASNVITISFESSVALATGDMVIVKGLSMFGDISGTVTLAGDDHAKFSVSGIPSRAGWLSSGGRLILKTNQVVSGITSVTAQFTNLGTAVGPITPTIAATISGSTSGIAEVDMVPTLMYVGSTFTVATIVGTNEIEGALNAITITLKCDADLAKDDSITIRGLSMIKHVSSALQLSGISHASFKSFQGGLNSTAGWTENGGILVLTANTGINANTTISVIINFTNKALAQATAA
eukprot:Stramenopile-MAST_4_protein_4251